ncbi:hypothetical protein FA15DRAFT_704626 [Coprinopsis marcescibilis]|uniref:Uncharacterized protein n=1 Tax=Coprinopsis marcescibilis TaxID=230819 RepID=A0A5C3L829_COPMA|nr:hypothetical protein FA15DRAFT_704626 [Coprinopsis marcescibilis]
MASKPYSDSPWPAATPKPTPAPTSNHVEPRSMKRRRSQANSGLELRSRGDEASSLVARQVIVDQALIEQAMHDCQFLSGNEIVSCYPTASTVVPQHQWVTFVWNSRRPEIIQFNRVNIYLFRGDSQQEVLSFLDYPNPTDRAGFVTAQVNDSWFGPDAERWSGENISYPFYWAITRADEVLDGNQFPQATFSAIQTTIADSVSASRSSASVASVRSVESVSASLSSASVASLSAISAATRLTTINGTPTTLTGTFAFPTGNVQSEVGNDSFPRWAIAVIVVLGFLAIAATCALAFLILRRIRRRNQSLHDSNRNSMGSASPMMANADQQASPLLAPAVLSPSTRRPESLRRNDSHGGQTAPSVVLHDGESGISGEGGPFSGADAAIMADAFRKMLRKPDFAANPVEEGESPESNNPDGGGGAEGQQMLSRELAEEGRDIRSVGSSRGVRVESLSDHGDPPRDPPENRP